jgi:hypothetical protein
MCIALIGGMDRLKSDYRRMAIEYGVDLRHFERDCPCFEKRLNGMDAIIIFTNRISHGAWKIALSKGKGAGIPILMSHSCGMSSLKRCLDKIVNPVRKSSPF